MEEKHILKCVKELRRPLATVRMALSLFERFGMIEIIDDILHLSSWEKYQSTDKLAEIREQTRKRVAKCRENKRLAECNVNCNVTSNGCNDIEEEGEEDLDKESHSFTLSREEAKLKYLGGTLGKGVVMLSDEQIDDLLDKLSIEEFNKYVAIVADCELNGKPYKKKTHYQAILDMARKDRSIKKG